MEVLAFKNNTNIDNARGAKIVKVSASVPSDSKSEIDSIIMAIKINVIPM